MATHDDGEIANAITSALADFPIACLKKEQQEALCAFLNGRDVCAFLPTGFGKSLIYQLAPVVVRKLERMDNPIVIVVSPLVALMDDQVKEAQNLGIPAAKLGDNENDIFNGKCQLVFGSPESWLMNTKWRNLLTSRVYQNNLVGVVVDEVHATYKWGEGAKGQPAFRESFSKLGELRSIVREGTPFLALTASAETKHRDRVIKLLHMEAATFVTVSPNRENIRLGLCPVPATSLSCMDWIVDMIQREKQSMSPIIIYCKSLKTVGRVFCHLKAELGNSAWINDDHKSANLLIGVFHSKTLQHHKDRLLKSLKGDGHCRVVVATTALGMGLNFPNVSHIVMYGTPNDVEAIVQQVGRAGRHGLQSHAILYVIKQVTRDDATVKDVIAKGSKDCFRKALYSHFEESAKSVKPGHLCCTFCHSQCVCKGDGCTEPRPLYESFEKVTYSLKCREVKPTERQLVQDCLEDYMSSLGSQTNQVFTSTSLCTGFSTELITAVVDHCAHIFDLNYILKNLPVFRLEHAKEILLIISEVFGDINYEYTTSDEVLPDLDIYFAGYFEDDEDEDEYDVATPQSSQDSDTWYH